MARYKYQKTSYSSYLIVLLAGIIMGIIITSALFYEIPKTENNIVPPVSYTHLTLPTILLV